MVEFRRSEPGGTPGLGNSANTVTPLGSRKHKKPLKKQTKKQLRELRNLRFARRQRSRDFLLADARSFLQGLEADPSELARVAPRPAKCGLAAAAMVSVHMGAGGSFARYCGLQSCASIWSCPTCSAIIRARRAEEIQHAADWWEHEKHGSFLFASFTLRHFREDWLGDSLDVLLEAFRRLTRGAPWKRFTERYGIRHQIKAVEVTLSWRNGWHPHLHVLWFTDAPLSRAAMKAARDWLSSRWQTMVVKLGGRMPSKSRGVDVRAVQDGHIIGGYIGKLQEHDEAEPGKFRVGLEMARIDSKKGRFESMVPFNLLEDTSGLTEQQAAQISDWWCEFVDATRGRRATTWSRGLKDECGLNDQSDEEILEAEEASADYDDCVLMIHAKDWRKIVHRPNLVTRVLDLVELGRADDVGDFVPILLPQKRAA